MKTPVLLSLLLLSGCVPSVFEKEGGSTAEFEQSKHECIYQAQLHVNSDPFMWPMIVRSCLQGKGWRIVK